jgi:predicted double-glycine peptidase
MIKKILLLLPILLFTSCENSKIPDISNNTVISQSVAKTSIKKFNVSQRKITNTANKNNKEKTFLKDLPKNFLYVPLTRQATDYTCGVGVTQSIFMYYGDEYMEGELAKELKADPNEGTSYHNINNFAKSNGYKVNIMKNMTLEQLKKNIDAKKPVIVLIQAWSEKPVDYSNDWEDGHYSIVVGYDANKIYLMDPSTLGNYTYIPTKDFLDRWHDVDINEKLYNFGMTIEKSKPKYNQTEILMLG